MLPQLDRFWLEVFDMNFLEKCWSEPSETCEKFPLTISGNIPDNFGRIPSRRWKRPFFRERPLGRQNSVDDYLLRFSLIARERNSLQTWKLSQKIPLVILHRLVYNLLRKIAFLKSEIAKIGRLRPFLGFFSILSLQMRGGAKRLCLRRWAGSTEHAWGGRRGLITVPERFHIFNTRWRFFWTIN